MLLGLYALADMGIHYDGWTLLDTVSFFRSYDGIVPVKSPFPIFLWLLFSIPEILHTQCNISDSEMQDITVTGPLGTPVHCTYGIIRDTGTAVLEMSGAITAFIIFTLFS